MGKAEPDGLSDAFVLSGFVKITQSLKRKIIWSSHYTSSDCREYSPVGVVGGGVVAVVLFIEFMYVCVGNLLYLP